MLSSVFMFISLLVMTRFVGSEYGVMMWGWAMVGLINTISDLGFDTATVKFISEGKDQNTCISTHLFLKSILIGIIILITVVYLIFAITVDGMTMDRVMIIVIFLAYYVLSDLVWVLIRTFDGRLEAAKSSIIQTSDAMIRSLTLMILAFFGSTASILSMGYVVGAAFSLFIALYLFRTLHYKPTKPAYLRDYVFFAKPIAVGLLLVTAISFIDKVIIEFFWNTTELGYYTATFGVVYAATAIGVALNYVLLPKFSELFSIKDRKSVENVLWKSEKYISMIFIPAVVFMMVFGDSIATVLFGADFISAGSMMSILALYIYLNIIIGIMTQVLHSTNNNHLYRNATVIYAVITLILLFLLVPENIGGLTMMGLGADGAALAITTGYLLFTIVTCYYVKRSVNMTLYKGLIKQFLAAAIVFAVLFLIRGDSTFSLLPLIPLLLLCFGLFYALLFLFKEMDKGDLRFIVDSLSPKKMYEGPKE